MAAGGGTKAIIAALVANMGIAITKFIAFIITGSSAMMAESVHSLADTGNQALLLLGGRRAAREPSPAHPFGYGRERYFWAFVVSIILFSLGSLFALYEAFHKIEHPEPLESPGFAIGVLIVSIVLETFSFRTAIHEARPHKGTSSWVHYIRRSKSPELPVVLLEDLGALCGLVFALVAVIIATVTHNGVWDGIGSLVIGILLGIIAIVLAVEMKSLLIGEAASPEQEGRIRELIESGESVTSLIWLRTQHLGPDELLVAAKVEFDPGLDMTGLARAIDDIEARCARPSPSPSTSSSSPTYGRPAPRRRDTAGGSRTVARVADDGIRQQLEVLGRYIRDQRQQAQLSLRELAARTNVSNPYLSQIERGLHEPSVRVLKAIAGALNVSLETLLGAAGLVGPAPDDLPDTEAAIRRDPRLTDEQRASLLAVYRSYMGPPHPAGR